jgi:predicted 2-oxoglutarate/Fe(II)-dependent dioxygenase YbiX
MVRIALEPDHPLAQRKYPREEMLDLRVPTLWTVPEVLTREECRAQIERIESLHPVAAPITTHRGFVMRPDIRNNTRVMIEDVPFAAELYRRVQHTLPALIHDVMRPVGANERLRCYRYDAGQRFAPHYDGRFQRSADEESLLTFMVYLNEEFTGGETAFLDLELAIKPVTGMALFFQHRQLHEGSTVTSGVKYALRSDIMYAASPARNLPDISARGPSTPR